MQKYHLIISIFLICLWLGCGSEQATESTTDHETSPMDTTANTQMGGSNENHPTAVQPSETATTATPRTTMPLSNYKIKEGSFEGFLVGNWTYDISIHAAEDGVDESQKGKVLQIHKNMTYDIWDEEEKVETGSFTYNRDQAVLRLVPGSGQSSEWTVNYLNGAAIFIGTPTFGNNATQMRLKEGVQNLTN